MDSNTDLTGLWASLLGTFSASAWACCQVAQISLLHMGLPLGCAVSNVKEGLNNGGC